jgi:redox-regulated HSP33 family molecular chaperone
MATFRLLKFARNGFKHIFIQSTSLSSLRHDNHMIRSLSESKNVSVKVLSASQLIYEATSQHNCSKHSAYALGQCIMANILLAAGRDTHETVQVQLRDIGNFGLICTEAVTSNDKIICARG